MEEGLWEEANTEKLRLEEKQRAVRRARENEAEKATDQGELFKRIYGNETELFSTLKKTRSW